MGNKQLIQFEAYNKIYDFLMDNLPRISPYTAEGLINTQHVFFGGSHIIEGEYHEYDVIKGTSIQQENAMDGVNTFLRRMHDKGKGIHDLYLYDGGHIDGCYPLLIFENKPTPIEIKGLDNISEDNIYGVITIADKSYFINVNK